MRGEGQVRTRLQNRSRSSLHKAETKQRPISPDDRACSLIDIFVGHKGKGGKEGKIEEQEDDFRSSTE